MPTSRRALLKSAAAAVGAAALSGAQGKTGATTNNAAGRLHKLANPNELLWYRAPADNWLEALPIGNGHMAAMVFGGVEQERLQLNEGTVWAGSPHDYTSPDALAALPEIRNLVFEEKWNEAQRLVDAKFMGRPAGQMPYQTVGSLMLAFAKPAAISEYHRELDLTTAIARTTYVADDVRFTREVFASAPDKAIFVRLAASKPGAISFRASFESPQKSQLHTDGASTLMLDGVSGDAGGLHGSVRFQAAVKVTCEGGKLTAGASYLEITAADSVTLRIAIGSSYKSYSDVSGDPAISVAAALSSPLAYDRSRKSHIADYRRLYGRVSLDLSGSAGVHSSPSKSEVGGLSSALPTDERVRRYTEGADPELAALHFQYGRYLLISCSRPGGQPATLQGLWNDSVSPPWGSKYTININTEMNYWPAGPTNLFECYRPLVEMLKELTETGKLAAKGMYGARGWVCHHNTDGWRGTSPVDASFYGMWPSGGAWLCKNLWDLYDYTRDRSVLKECYPILRGAGVFFLDALVEEPTHGWLVTCPSVSPEHGHHQGVSICAGPTMDIQIITDLFRSCSAAAELLGEDADLREKWKSALAKFPPMQVGKAGQLQEWIEDWDMTAEDIHHRHVSHLYGLHPSDQITRRNTPDLFAAARKSLEIRGDLSTGWSLAWKINLWARLEDGDRAFKLLGYLLTPERTAPNLFDLHPPFQIDGNFGAASGIAEMLLQSRSGEINLLPALPSAWPAGRVAGLRARGAFTADLVWSGGKLDSARIRSHAGAPCSLRYGELAVSIPTKRDAVYVFNRELKPTSV